MLLRIERLLTSFKGKTKLAPRAGNGEAGRAYSVIPSPDVRASLQEDGVVFLNLRSGMVFRSNRIGAEIWKGLGGRRELSSIAAEIGRQYGVPADQAALDTAAFVAQLETQGFVVRRVGE